MSLSFTFSASAFNVKAEDSEGCNLAPLALGGVRQEVLPRHVHLHLAARLRWSVVSTATNAVLPCRKLNPVAAHNFFVYHESEMFKYCIDEHVK